MNNFAVTSELGETQTIHQAVYLNCLIGVSYSRELSVFLGWIRQQHFLWTSVFDSYAIALEAAKCKACEWFIYGEMQPCFIARIYDKKIVAINSIGRKQFSDEIIMPQRSQLLKLKLGEHLLFKQLCFYRLDFSFCLAKTS